MVLPPLAPSRATRCDEPSSSSTAQGTALLPPCYSDWERYASFVAARQWSPAFVVGEDQTSRSLLDGLAPVAVARVYRSRTGAHSNSLDFRRLP